MKTTARLLAIVALAGAFATPASATDCSNPKQDCGGCRINRDISTADPRPFVCYI